MANEKSPWTYDMQGVPSAPNERMAWATLQEVMAVPGAKLNQSLWDELFDGRVNLVVPNKFHVSEPLKLLAQAPEEKLAQSTWDWVLEEHPELRGMPTSKHSGRYPGPSEGYYNLTSKPDTAIPDVLLFGDFKVASPGKSPDDDTTQSSSMARSSKSSAIDQDDDCDDSEQPTDDVRKSLDPELASPSQSSDDDADSDESTKPSTTSQHGKSLDDEKKQSFMASGSSQDAVPSRRPMVQRCWEVLHQAMERLTQQMQGNALHTRGVAVAVTGRSLFVIVGHRDKQRLTMRVRKLEYELKSIDIIWHSVLQSLEKDRDVWFSPDTALIVATLNKLNINACRCRIKFENESCSNVYSVTFPQLSKAGRGATCLQAAAHAYEDPNSAVRSTCMALKVVQPKRHAEFLNEVGVLEHILTKLPSKHKASFYYIGYHSRGSGSTFHWEHGRWPIYCCRPRHLRCFVHSQGHQGSNRQQHSRHRDAQEGQRHPEQNGHPGKVEGGRSHSARAAQMAR